MRHLIETLVKLCKQLFRADNMMVSFTAQREGLQGMEEQICSFKQGLLATVVEETPCVIHCKKRNEGFMTSSKVQYVARVGNFLDAGFDYTGAFQILKVIYIVTLLVMNAYPTTYNNYKFYTKYINNAI